jgi:hypothetical protein
MTKTMTLKIVVLLLISSQIILAGSEAQKNYQIIMSLEKAKDAGSTIMGLGIVGTAVGVGMLIGGNVVMYKNDNYHGSPAKWHDGKNAVVASGYCYGIGIPMIVTGAIIRGVCKGRIRSLSGEKYGLNIGINSVTLNYSF